MIKIINIMFNLKGTKNYNYFINNINKNNI